MVLGLKFSESHPPVNRAANGGVSFINGPELSMSAFNPMAAVSVLPFTDVAAGSWYLDAVRYVYEKDLMQGTSGSAFAPNQPMNRAMVWTILARLYAGHQRQRLRAQSAYEPRHGVDDPGPSVGRGYHRRQSLVCTGPELVGCGRCFRWYGSRRDSHP